MEEKAIPTIRVTGSPNSNTQPDYKKLSDVNTKRVSAILGELEALIPKSNFRSTKVAKSHIHMMRVLHALVTGETLGLGIAYDEPRTYKEAKALPDWPRWKEAMEVEHDSLVENKTWEPCRHPKVSGR